MTRLSVARCQFALSRGCRTESGPRHDHSESRVASGVTFGMEDINE